MKLPLDPSAHVLQIPESMSALVEPMKAIIAAGDALCRSGADPEEFCRSEQFQKVMATYRAAIVEVLAQGKKPTR